MATLVLSVSLSQAYAHCCSTDAALTGADSCTPVVEAACCCTAISDTTSTPCECTMEEREETLTFHFEGSRTSVPQLLSATVPWNSLHAPATSRSAKTALVARQLPGACSAAVLCRFLL